MALRAGLWFLAIAFAVTGFWAALAPQSFFASVVAGLPHLLFHLHHLDQLTAADASAEVSTLTLTAVQPVALLAALQQARPRDCPTPGREQRPRRRERAV